MSFAILTGYRLPDGYQNFFDLVTSINGEGIPFLIQKLPVTIYFLKKVYIFILLRSN